MFANRFFNLPGLACIALMFALGTAGSVSAQITVSLPDIDGLVGSPVTLDIVVGDMTGRNVSGYQLEISYDPDVIEFTGIATSGTLSDDLTTMSNSPSRGVFRVVGAGASPLSGSGTLLRLNGMFGDAGTTELAWNEFAFDNPEVSATLGAGSASATDQIAEIGVTVGDVSDRPGAFVLIPVRVDDLSGLEVAGYTFGLSWDSSVISVSGISTAGTLSAGRSPQVSYPTAQSIFVQDAEDAYLEGDGTLLYLKGTLAEAGTSALDVTSFAFDRLGVDATVTDGAAVVVNAAPQFTSSPVTVARAGIRYEYPVVAVDSDGDQLTLSAPTLPVWASFKDNGDGTGLLYGLPGEGSVGVHDVKLSATDIFGVSGLQTFSISVKPNGVPIAVPDNVHTPRGVAVEIDVLANDSDPDGDVLTLQHVSTAEHGSTQITPDGRVLYTPQTAYIGTDTFTYRISDGLDVAEGQVSVLVQNAAPVATDDTARLFAGDAIVIDVLANDSDANDDDLRLVSLTDPTGGTVSITADGAVSYTSYATFEGEDVFEYTVADAFGATDMGNITVTVLGLGPDGDGVDDDIEAGAPNGGDGNNDGIPDAEQTTVASFPIAYGPNAGTYLTLEVPDNLTLTRVQSTDNPSPSTAPEGSFPLGFFSFTVEGLEPGGLFETTLIVPEGVDVTGFMRYGPTEDATAPHWYDFWYDGLTGAIIEPGMIRLIYVDGARGDDDLQANGILVDDGAPILRSNQTPVALSDAVTTDEDTPVIIRVLDNDYDVDGDPLMLASVSEATHGTVEDLGDGTLRYTPDTDYNGSDLFSYSVTDGQAVSSPADVSLTVQPTDDPPQARDDTVETLAGVAIDIDIFANDYDPDGAFHLVQLVQPSSGRATFLGDGMVRYVPEARFMGEDLFSYTIGDGTSMDEATVTVTVLPVGVSPAAMADAAATDEDVPLRIDVLSNDTDPDGDALSVHAFTQPSNGQVALLVDGALTYTPAPNFFGTDTFSYTVTDGVWTASAEVAVEVAAVNDPPYFPDSDWLVSPADGEQITLVGDPDFELEIQWPDATDIDGDELGYTLQISTSVMFEAQNMVYEGDLGQQTMFRYRQGDLAAALTSMGVDLNEATTVYFRVMVSDGQEQIMSQITTSSMIRGAITGVGEATELPRELMLGQNYPNPFNPETTIGFELPESSYVRLTVFDMVGAEVAVLVDGMQAAGRHTVTFHAEDLPSGTYVYRLMTDTQSLTKTLTYLK